MRVCDVCNSQFNFFSPLSNSYMIYIIYYIYIYIIKEFIVYMCIYIYIYIYLKRELTELIVNTVNSYYYIN